MYTYGGVGMLCNSNRREVICLLVVSAAELGWLILFRRETV